MQLPHKFYFYGVYSKNINNYTKLKIIKQGFKCITINYLK